MFIILLLFFYISSFKGEYIAKKNLRLNSTAQINSLKYVNETLYGWTPHNLFPSQDFIYVNDLKTKKETYSGPFTNFNDVFSPDGNMFIIYLKNQIIVWDRSSNTNLNSLKESFEIFPIIGMPTAEGCYYYVVNDTLKIMNPVKGTTENLSQNADFSKFKIGYWGLYDHINNQILFLTPFSYFYVFNPLSGILKKQNTEERITMTGFLLNPENHTVYISHNSPPYYNSSYVAQYDYILDSIAIRSNNVSGLMSFLVFGGNKQQIYYYSPLNKSLNMYDFNYQGIRADLHLNLEMDSIATDVANKRLFLSLHDPTDQLKKNVSINNKSIIILTYTYIMEVYQFNSDGDLNKSFKTNSTLGIQNKDELSGSNKLIIIIVVSTVGGLFLLFLFILFLYKHLNKDDGKKEIKIPQIESENELKYENNKQKSETENELRSEQNRI